MPKSRGRKPKPTKQAQPPPSSIPKKPWWTIPKTIVAGAIVTIGAVASVATILPRIDVTVSPQADPVNESSIEFRATNRSVFTLANTSVEIALCEISGGDNPFPTVSCDVRKVATFIGRNCHNITLAIDDSCAIRMDDLLKTDTGKLSGANIGIIVRYRPWFWPWQQTKAFHFFTERQTNGALYWRQVPAEGMYPPSPSN